MADFKKDLSTLIKNGALIPNNGTIRFVFRYKDKFNDNIDELNLGERAYNCLRRAKIDTIENVGEHWDNLGEIKQCGLKSVKEIKNKYLSFYYNSLNKDKRMEFWKDTIKATYLLSEEGN